MWKAASGRNEVTVKKELFGKTKEGREVFQFTLQNERGVAAGILNYGGTIRQILTPDRTGQISDIVLGYDTVTEYEENDGYFGAAVGRVANRIKGAAFELNGESYTLTANEGSNMLHGGSGFHTKIWDDEMRDDALVLKYTSPDGEDGFPGNLRVEQIITLSEENVLRIEYHAFCDKDTLCSLTGHSYFNLSGGFTGTVAAHQMQIAANEYTPVGEDLIPTGEVLPVAGTAYDFLSARAVGTAPLDVNLVLSKAFRKWDVRVLDPSTGRFLSERTSLPGLQVYNGTGITERKGKGGALYGLQSGLALEPQFYPDAIHHPEFHF